LETVVLSNLRQNTAAQSLGARRVPGISPHLRQEPRDPMASELMSQRSHRRARNTRIVVDVAGYTDGQFCILKIILV